MKKLLITTLLLISGTATFAKDATKSQAILAQATSSENTLLANTNSENYLQGFFKGVTVHSKLRTTPQRLSLYVSTRAARQHKRIAQVKF